jgi:C4-dicarboxylate-specific signal transduction histidine kinase
MGRMRMTARARDLSAWLLLAAAGCGVLALRSHEALRERFDADARVAHRLLSQRAAQHDAVLATLALLQPAADDESLLRLASVVPQITGVKRIATDAPGEFAEPLARSRKERAAAFASADLRTGRVWLVLAAAPASYALEVNMAAAVPWCEWPVARDGPVRFALELGGQAQVLQPGHGFLYPIGSFSVRKKLSSASQPLDLVASRDVGLTELPWPAWLAWAIASAALVAAASAWQRQRAARRRAEELLRLGQVARLNTLGELAAGIAHELNQPLTAVAANAQAARRLLDEEEPDLASARNAMAQAAQQARRASDVVARLRRTIEKPGSEPARPVVLNDAVRSAFELLEPEFARRSVSPRLHGSAPVRVQAEPVALEQIVHNLLMNALQALEKVPAAERELAVEVAAEPEGGVLSVADSGPGIAPDLLPRIFEPFFSTREQGLGLGLSLCESLATGMGGSLQALARSPRGAIFRLTLPIAA